MRVIETARSMDLFYRHFNLLDVKKQVSIDATWRRFVRGLCGEREIASIYLMQDIRA
jgi:hypothetical protein